MSELDRIELLAKACHSSLKTWVSLHGQNYAIPRWERLSIEDRTFAKEVTSAILWEMLRSDVQPEHVHMIWMHWRRQMGYGLGWRRNRSLRMHPNMVPYSALPENEQPKAKIILETLRLLGTMVVEQRSLSIGGFQSYG